MNGSNEVSGDAKPPDRLVGMTATLSIMVALPDAGIESPRSDVAQQRSASDWLVKGRDRLESPLLCSGHSCSSAQQTIRASGVASQPWHSARCPPGSAATIISARKHFARLSTS